MKAVEMAERLAAAQEQEQDDDEEQEKGDADEIARMIFDELRDTSRR